ncbi:MAG: single-stranded DNA-binding protein, partial [bacterium]
MYLNKALLIGNLTRDPEMKALPSGIQVASFSVATNRVWKDKDGKKQESVDFHNVVVFGRQAEIVGQYMKKGSSIFVEGRMQTRSWDAQDGTKKYRTELIADKIQFGPKTTSSPSGQSDSSSYAKKPSSAQEEIPDNGGELKYPEEEI